MGRGKNRQPSEDACRLIDKAPDKDFIPPSFNTRHQRAIQVITSTWNIPSPEYAIPPHIRPTLVTETGDFVNKSLTQALHGIAERESDLWKVQDMIEEEYKRRRADPMSANRGYEVLLGDLEQVHYRLAEEMDKADGDKENEHIDVEDDDVEIVPHPLGETVDGKSFYLFRSLSDQLSNIASNQLVENTNSTIPSRSGGSAPGRKRRRNAEACETKDEEITLDAEDQRRQLKKRRLSSDEGSIAAASLKNKPNSPAVVSGRFPPLKQASGPDYSGDSMDVDPAPIAQSKLSSDPNSTSRQPSYPEDVLRKPVQFEYIKSAAQQRMIPIYRERVQDHWGLTDATLSIPENIRPAGLFEQWDLDVIYAIYALAQQGQDLRFIQAVHHELQARAGTMPLTAAHAEAVVTDFVNARNTALAQQTIEKNRKVTLAKAKRSARSSEAGSISKGSKPTQSRNAKRKTRGTHQSSLPPYPIDEVEMEDTTPAENYASTGDLPEHTPVTNNYQPIVDGHTSSNLDLEEKTLRRMDRDLEINIRPAFVASPKHVPKKFERTLAPTAPADPNDMVATQLVDHYVGDSDEEQDLTPALPNPGLKSGKVLKRNRQSRRLARDGTELKNGLEKEPQMWKPRAKKMLSKKQHALLSALQPVQDADEDLESNISIGDGATRSPGREESAQLDSPDYSLSRSQHLHHGHQLEEGECLYEDEQDTSGSISRASHDCSPLQESGLSRVSITYQVAESFSRRPSNYFDQNTNREQTAETKVQQNIDESICIEPAESDGRGTQLRVPGQPNIVVGDQQSTTPSGSPPGLIPHVKVGRSQSLPLSFHPNHASEQTVQSSPRSHRLALAGIHVHHMNLSPATPVALQQQQILQPTVAPSQNFTQQQTRDELKRCESQFQDTLLLHEEAILEAEHARARLHEMYNRHSWDEAWAVKSDWEAKKKAVPVLVRRIVDLGTRIDTLKKILGGYISSGWQGQR